MIYLIYACLESSVSDISPPDGCTCIKSGPDVGCYHNVPAKCVDWDNHGYHWCYVANEDACREKQPNRCGGYWAKCGMLVSKINFL